MLTEVKALYLVASSVMVGVIWVMQLVHYPIFNFINAKHFSDFENFHSRRISLIVIPIMLIELAAALILLIYESSIATVFNIVIISAIWAMTLLVSARIHNKLLQGYEPDLVEKLVKSNWVRTLLWTIKLVLAIVILQS